MNEREVNDIIIINTCIKQLRILIKALQMLKKFIFKRKVFITVII